MEVTWRVEVAGKDAEEASDEALVRRVLSGARDDFRVLVQRHSREVYGLLRRRTGDHHTAEELAQEVFLRAYRSLGTFRFDASFSTWLIRIALNCGNSWHGSRLRSHERVTVPFDPRLHEHAGPEEHEPPALTRIQAAMDRLSPKLREVMLLCGLEGRSYEEAATILLIPIGTVRSRLNAARLALRACVKESEEEVR